ncbi:hypothetical protein [Streptomyces sp. NPDC057554]|uniref:hypothetical protein n=1 Tax=Streptomyces sp. NPDC057554 TaxID=3350538 RepID=UPI00367ED310
MSQVLHRRIAPALVILQLLYLVLMELAFTFLAPATAEPAPAGSALPVYWATVAGVAVVMAAGALVLASAPAGARVPGPVRWVLLALLGLLELGIAASFLHAAVTGSPGPDTVIAGLGVPAACSVVAGCVLGLRAERTPRASRTPLGSEPHGVG